MMPLLGGWGYNNCGFKMSGARCLGNAASGSFLHGDAGRLSAGVSGSSFHSAQRKLWVSASPALDYVGRFCARTGGGGNNERQQRAAASGAASLSATVGARRRRRRKRVQPKTKSQNAKKHNTSKCPPINTPQATASSTRPRWSARSARSSAPRWNDGEYGWRAPRVQRHGVGGDGRGELHAYCLSILPQLQRLVTRAGRGRRRGPREELHRASNVLASYNDIQGDGALRALRDAIRAHLADATFPG